jgi:nitrogen fixation-related uncharacterized protein
MLERLRTALLIMLPLAIVAVVVGLVLWPLVTEQRETAAEQAAQDRINKAMAALDRHYEEAGAYVMATEVAQGSDLVIELSDRHVASSEGLSRLAGLGENQVLAYSEPSSYSLLAVAGETVFGVRVNRQPDRRALYLSLRDGELVEGWQKPVAAPRRAETPPGWSKEEFEYFQDRQELSVQLKTVRRVFRVAAWYQGQPPSAADLETALQLVSALEKEWSGREAPSSRFKESHGYLVEALGLYGELTPHFEDGISAKEAEELGVAAELELAIQERLARSEEALPRAF